MSSQEETKPEMVKREVILISDSENDEEDHWSPQQIGRPRATPHPGDTYGDHPIQTFSNSEGDGPAEFWVVGNPKARRQTIEYTTILISPPQNPETSRSPSFQEMSQNILQPPHRIKSPVSEQDFPLDLSLERLPSTMHFWV
jgi:hypothetical protein